MRYVLGIIFAALFSIAPACASHNGCDVIAKSCAESMQPLMTLAQVQTPAPGAVGGTSISTTAPVSSDTNINVGTMAGEVLKWLAAVLSIPIATLITALLQRAFQSWGLKLDEQNSDKLNRALVNGLNDAAQNGAKLADGKFVVDVKDPIVASAIRYAIDKVPGTIKALGLDPDDGKTVQVLRARIATLAQDPSKPTPPSISPNGNGAH